MVKQYADRDAWAMDKAGGYYMRHVQAMTAEALHSKSDIAAELAHRDIAIAALEARCRQYEEAFHKAFNQFENITVADTLEIAKERAHQMIGWAYASMPDYAPETPDVKA